MSNEIIDEQYWIRYNLYTDDGRLMEEHTIHDLSWRLLRCVATHLEKTITKIYTKIRYIFEIIRKLFISK